MHTRLVQYRDDNGAVAVAMVHDDGTEHNVPGASSVYALAQAAIAEGISLAATAAKAGTGEAVQLAALYAAGRLLSPVTHPSDSAHVIVSGTGLTHLGSAEGRDKMHKKMADPDNVTDSIRMFRMGLEGGKPVQGQAGVQPEWFYKGDGSIVAGPGQPLVSPAFAKDGGEEPEIAGIYLIGPDGQPWRIGFALGNEFSDHVTERGNYLWLAHSKLRAASLGPEVLLGELPGSVTGTSKIVRNGATVWEKPFVSGEDNMSHSVANLEHHHFKYGLFCRPGDIHIHFFGTATLSCTDGFMTEAGDVFEISAAPFTLPVRNPLALAAGNDTLVSVRSL